MEEQVSRLTLEVFIVVVLGGDHRLDRFFSDLLCDPVDPFREEPGYIGVVRRFVAPFFDYRLEMIEERRTRAIAIAETSIGTGMTNGALGLGLDEDRVAVTIGDHRNDLNMISTRLAFPPKSSF